MFRVLVIAWCCVLVDSGALLADSPESAALEAARLEELQAYLVRPRGVRPALAQLSFAKAPLTRAQAEEATKLLWADLAAHILENRSAEMKERILRHGDLEMPFHYETFGEAPATGRSLYISMHGGGGAPKRVNDQQWENQKRLYRPKEGIYLAPRAPTSTWNLWHQSHIDPLFDRLITNMVVFENVDPNRVYVMGYSAGGDGVFQLAPRMADRLAAAAMMAGHPNETSPLGLRNLPFTLHMGGKDAAYERNEIAREWKKKLAMLHAQDPAGYHHSVEIHEDKSHWMDREDAVAVPWMAKHRRQVTPSRIVWVQDDVTHARYYWLAVKKPRARARVVAEVESHAESQTVKITTDDVSSITVRFNDDLLDLDRPVTIIANGKTLFEGRVHRTLATLAKTLAEREDPKAIFAAEIQIAIDE